MLRFRCSSCGREFHVSDEWAGRRAKCAKCGGVILVPGLEAPELVQEDWLAPDMPPTGELLRPVGSRPIQKQTWIMVLAGVGVAALLMIMVVVVSVATSPRQAAPAAVPPVVMSAPAATPSAPQAAIATSVTSPPGVAVIQSPGQGAPWPSFSNSHQWQLITDSEGRCYVVMPDQPRRGPDKGVQGVMYYTVAKCGPPASARCSIGWEDLSRVAVWLHGGAEGMLSQFDKVKDDPSCTHFQQIQLNGHPGVELTTRDQRDSETIFHHSRTYLVGNRYYCLDWFGPSESVDDPDVRSFFDSFGLDTPPPQPPGIPIGQPIPR